MLNEAMTGGSAGFGDSAPRARLHAPMGPGRSTAPRASVRLLQPVVELLEEKSPNAFADACRQLNVPLELFDDLCHRIPVDVAVRIVDRAATVAGDPYLGLHSGERVDSLSLGLLLYLVDSCVTVRETILCHNYYYRLLSEAGKWSLDVEDDMASWAYEAEGDSHRHLIEGHFAAIVSRARREFPEWSPARIDFRHGRPSDPSELKRVFRCPLRFGAPRDVLYVPAAHLDTPRWRVDHRMYETLSAHADTLIAEDDGDLAYRVRALLARGLNGEYPSQEDVAARLHMSSSTLRRRLRTEGISFRQLLEDLRRDLAVRYLREGELSTGELAFRLGFSHVNSFYRWYKRWAEMGNGRRIEEPWLVA